MSEGDAERSYAAGIARGAGVLAVLTIGARMFGLVRTLAFSQTVGATCLGTAYVTANQVPNLVYELVLGGALSTVMVPLLARSAARSAVDPAEKAQVSHVTSALLTWCLLILVPLTIIIVAVAGPVAALLNPTNPSADCVHADVVSTTASMLRIFAPQALLYGLSVVLLGVLQAYRRFAAYALAPLVNSMVVIASLLAFVPLGRGVSLGRLSGPAQLVLSAGATLGVAAMVVVALWPIWRLRLRLRPTLRLPPGVARRAGGLALVGIVEIVASEISAVVVIALANGRGATGALVLFSYGSQVFNTLNAVLALSISISAFPVLAARGGTVFDRACAGSTRAVVLASCLGVALMGAVMVPAARVLAGQQDQVSQLTLAFALFAPGLIGLGVIANLARALLAVGRLKIAAAAVAGGILLGVLAQLVLVQIVPARLTVAALALGNTIGLTVVAVPLVVVTRRVLGATAVQGVGRTTLVGLAAAVGGGGVGIIASLALPVSGKLAEAGAAALAAVSAAIVFGAVAFRLDEGDVRPVLARVLRVAGPRPALRASHNLGGLIRSSRQRAGVQPWVEGRRQMLRMNSMNHRDGREADEGQPSVPLLTRRERQVAFGIGVIAGGAGGYAVFASSNQAGTVLLLLIALVFLLVGVEGTPLLRLAARPGAPVAARVHRHRSGQQTEPADGQQTEPEDGQLAAGLVEEFAVPEPRRVTQPVASSAGPDDGSRVFPAE
ncbi:MAG: murein biosynthesis integral membrane protein MurJ [Streptosporangiaceae bacterium]